MLWLTCWKGCDYRKKNEMGLGQIWQWGSSQRESFVGNENGVIPSDFNPRPCPHRDRVQKNGR